MTCVTEYEELCKRIIAGTAASVTEVNFAIRSCEGEENFEWNNANLEMEFEDYSNNNAISDRDFDNIQVGDVPKKTNIRTPSFARLVFFLVSGKLPNLHKLNLSNTNLEDKHLIFLLEKVFKGKVKEEEALTSQPKFIEEVYLQNNLLSAASLEALAKYLPNTDIYYLNLSYNKKIKPNDVMHYLYPILPETYLFHLYYYNEDTIQASQPSTDLLNLFQRNELKWKEHTASMCRIVCCFLRYEKKFFRDL